MDDLEGLEKMGLKSKPVARAIAHAALRLTGFRAFQKHLPDTIDDHLRQTNLRGPSLCAPVVSATTALADDPRGLAPIERAATLIFAARSLYADITSGCFTPDCYQGQVLEMGQYPNLFSTSLIVAGKKPRLFKSANVSQITVIVARQFYTLQIGPPDAETTIEQLISALYELAHSAQRNRLNGDAVSPGVLTCATDATQIKAFSRLQKVETNAQSLAALRHSFLTLCLDLDSTPASATEAAFYAQSTNADNRWHHASLQLVVFGNGRACLLFNFDAYLDGNVMMRGAAEMQKRAAQAPLAQGQERNLAKLPPPIGLRWEIDRRLIHRAHKEFQEFQDNQQATFVIDGIGQTFFAANRIRPVETFVAALQMTADQLADRRIKITQFLAMSKYCCGDLVTAVVSTPELLQFADYIRGDDCQPDRARQLLDEAIQSQVSAARKARQHLPLDEVLSLFMLSRQGVRRHLVLIVLALTFLLLQITGLFKLQRQEVLISHPQIYPEVPVVGRPGIRLPYVDYFGLHYQILANQIVVTMMPGLRWTVPNVEFMAVLRESLTQIKEIIQNSEEDGLQWTI
jgi:hypothetical protein